MDKKPLILIIDDEAYIRDILKIKLGSEGFEVECSENGTDGICLAINLRPDLILLDIEMPDIEGTEVIKKIKLNDELNEVKIFFYTSSGLRREDVIEMSKLMAIEIGALGLIRKETDLDEVVSILKEALK